MTTVSLKEGVNVQTDHNEAHPHSAPELQKTVPGCDYHKGGLSPPPPSPVASSRISCRSTGENRWSVGGCVDEEIIAHWCAQRLFLYGNWHLSVLLQNTLCWKARNCLLKTSTGKSRKNGWRSLSSNTCDHEWTGMAII